MKAIRMLAAAALTALLLACSSPSPQSPADQEISAMAPLKRLYPDIVMGFDVRSPAVLTISVDLQHYIDADDDTLAAMRRHALQRWRSAWIAVHPHAHGTLQVRFIDFIGRKVATETTKV